MGCFPGLQARITVQLAWNYEVQPGVRLCPLPSVFEWRVGWGSGVGTQVPFPLTQAVYTQDTASGNFPNIWGQ